MSYKFDSFVNNSEANALKEMIFNRVRERSQALTEDVQSDVMDMARKSFVSRNNPFSHIVANPSTKENKLDSFETAMKKAEEKEEIIKNDISEVEPEIGFPKRELNARAVEQERMVHEQIASSAIVDTMDDAREEFNNKKTFMGALNFLNSQAAVSLMRTRADKFEMIV